MEKAREDKLTQTTQTEKVFSTGCLNSSSGFGLHCLSPFIICIKSDNSNFIKFISDNSSDKLR